MTLLRRVLGLGLVLIAAAAVGFAALSRNISDVEPGATYPVSSVYVAPGGVDQVSSGGLGNPFHTIQYAVSRVDPGSTVVVASGVYDPFTVTTPNVSVVGRSRDGVLVRGKAGVTGVVALAGAGDRVDNLTVTGCQPNPTPAGSFEYSGSASVLVARTATGASVSRVTITNGHGINQYGLPFGCYGVYVAYGVGVSVSGSDISGQGEGVFLFRGGDGVTITTNVVHDNAYEVRDTPMDNDDFGGTAVGLFETGGTRGVTVSGNILYNNYAPSHDYGTDGGAFDIFQASDNHITNNVIYNNENILETGAGSQSGVCARNTFTDNHVSGRTAGSALTLAFGMILRCATNMTITGNDITGIDWCVFEIAHTGTWAGTLTNMAITRNTVTQNQGLIYVMLVDPRTVGFTSDHNHFTVGGQIGIDWTGHRIKTLAAWITATGTDANSTMRVGLWR